MRRPEKAAGVARRKEGGEWAGVGVAGRGVAVTRSSEGVAAGVKRPERAAGVVRRKVREGAGVGVAGQGVTVAWQTAGVERRSEGVAVGAKRPKRAAAEKVESETAEPGRSAVDRRKVRARRIEAGVAMRRAGMAG